MLRTFLKKNKKGFTLTELMIVVVIIGILTAIAIPIYSSVSAKAAASANADNLRTIESVLTQLTAYYECKVTDISITATDKIATATFATDSAAKDPETGAAITSVIITSNGTDSESVKVNGLLKEWPTPPSGYTPYSVQNGVIQGGEKS